MGSKPRSIFTKLCKKTYSHGFPILYDLQTGCGDIPPLPVFDFEIRAPIRYTETMFVYLFKLLLSRVRMFFVHWYRDGALFVYGRFLRLWRRIDQKFGLRVNARFLFQPLYQERNITGYTLGFLFRSFRLITGGALAIVLSGAMAFLFVVWLCVPAYLIVKIVTG